MKTLFLAGSAALLLGCATSQSDSEVAHQVEQSDTIQAAILYGEQLNTIYTNRGSRFRSNRTWISLGILAANTYVMAASGLEAHPDSIFAGALVGNTIHSLDPIINAGGPEAWSAAHARNVCVVAVASGLNTSTILADDALLRARRDDPTHAAAITRVLVRYDSYPARLTGVMREIYGRYLQASTPALPEVNSIARGVITERTERVTERDGAEGGAVEAMAVFSFDRRRIELGSAFWELLGEDEDEIPHAIDRMAAALDYADQELPKCRPEALTRGGAAPSEGDSADDGDGDDEGDDGDDEGDNESE